MLMFCLYWRSGIANNYFILACRNLNSLKLFSWVPWFLSPGHFCLHFPLWSCQGPEELKGLIAPTSLTHAPTGRGSGAAFQLRPGQLLSPASSSGWTLTCVFWGALSLVPSSAVSDWIFRMDPAPDSALSDHSRQSLWLSWSCQGEATVVTHSSWLVLLQGHGSALAAPQEEHPVLVQVLPCLTYYWLVLH